MTLQEEKERLSYEHRLKLWRIFINKLLLGLLIAAVAYFGNILLEDYKSKLTNQKFLLESRLSALRTIRNSYSHLSLHMINLINSSDLPEKYDLVPYQKAVSTSMNLANEYCMLFSEEFDKKIRYHMWLHDCIAKGYVPISMKHYSFACSIFKHFDILTRNALWEETLGVAKSVTNGSFEFEDWDIERMAKEGPKKFFKSNFKRWENSCGKPSKAVP